MTEYRRKTNLPTNQSDSVLYINRNEALTAKLITEYQLPAANTFQKMQR